MTTDEGTLAYRAAEDVPASLRAAFGYGYLASAVTTGAGTEALCEIIRGINRAIVAGTEEGTIA